MPGTSFEHARQHPLAQVDRRAHVDVDDAIVVLDRMFEERPVESEAGVVHEDVRRRPCGDVGYDPPDVIPVREVGGKNPGVDALQALGQCRQAGLVPGHQCEAAMLFAQGPGNSASEATAGAGDDGGLV